MSVRKFLLSFVGILPQQRLGSMHRADRNLKPDQHKGVLPRKGSFAARL